MARRPRAKPAEAGSKPDRMLACAIDWIAIHDEPEQSQWENLTVISKQKSVILASRLFEMRPEEIAFRVITNRAETSSQQNPVTIQGGRL